MRVQESELALSTGCGTSLQLQGSILILHDFYWNL
ncbi:hypothetical protein T4A_4799 [Trichinella pseudospiralis]|uniref:Uncharacterized protein n=1 Tax=Trichinella pseudospiralis TaxID=6337 RepID=A0A0V1C832_TRIPS|nr:hypothetical protein T4A_4799 [Trichinella pseudospiralis]